MRFRRFFTYGCLTLVTVAFCWVLALLSLPPGLAQVPLQETLTDASLESSLKSVSLLEITAKKAYQEGQLTTAIALWKNLAAIYQKAERPLEAGRIYSYLALAYQQLGQGSLAQDAITQALVLVENHTQAQNSDPTIWAEVLNNAGTLQLAQGNAQAALASWKEASQRSTADQTLRLRSQINQGKALMALGLYPAACQHLLKTLDVPESNCQTLSIEELNQSLLALSSQFNSVLSQGWLSLAIALRNLGQWGGAQRILETLWTEASTTAEKGAIAFQLGQLFQSNQEPLIALTWYEKVGQASPLLTVQTQLAQLTLWRSLNREKEAQQLLPVLSQNLKALPLGHEQIYAQINWYSQLIDWKQQQPNHPELPTWKEIAQSLAQLQQQARAIADQRGEIYSIGTLGQIYEQTQQWQIAQSLTKDALIQSQALNAPELTYLWQWQLARIEEQQGKRELALNSYLGAVETVKSITQDLAGNPEFRLTFQKNIDRLYRQLISLLLTPNAQNTVSQTDLQLARNQIESLQIEELNNFFRAVCLTKKTETIENIDPDAAIIYPLILPNRLALILSLPQQPLQIFNTAINAPTLEKAIAQFRQTIVIRSRRDFYGPAKELYNALIRPLEATLKAQKQLKTLVFVPDGSLRNIPLAALYNGQQFLLEQYRIAVTPGLQLLNPTSIKRANLHTLFAGITEDNDRPGFIPLAYVNQELEAVQSQVEISLLLNQAFTPEALKQKLTYEASGIVHLATHGRFSSQLQETFVDTWTQPLDISDLAALLKASNPTGETGLELLVLSACETAVGDQRAALGLAGMAVRSGAKSTMATLWSINDEATAQFMARFYQQLATQNVSKAEALRQAQLALLQNRWYKHPFYWAAYILVGDWL